MEVESRKIILSGNEFLFRPNFRCLLEYEKISGKGVNEIHSLSDSTMFLYSGVKAGQLFAKKEFKLTYDEFVELLDDLDVLAVLSDGAKEDEKDEKKK